MAHLCAMPDNIIDKIFKKVMPNDYELAIAGIHIVLVCKMFRDLIHSFFANSEILKKTKEKKLKVCLYNYCINNYTIKTVSTVHTVLKKLEYFMSWGLGNTGMPNWLSAFDYGTSAIIAGSGIGSNILQWAICKGCPWNDDTLIAAAKAGDIKILEYCISIDPNRKIYYGQLAVAASETGKLDFLKWIATICDSKRPKKQWKTKFLSTAVKYNQEEIINWAFEEHNLSLRNVISSKKANEVLEHIMNFNKIESLKTLGKSLDNQRIDVSNEITMRLIMWCIRTFNIKTLKWFETTKAFSITAEPGDEGNPIKGIELHQRMLNSDGLIIYQLKDIKNILLKENRFVRDILEEYWNKETEMVKYLYSRGCHFSTKVTEKASSTNNYKLLCWLLDEQCPYNGHIFTNELTNIHVKGWKKIEEKTKFMRYLLERKYFRPEELVEPLKNKISTLKSNEIEEIKDVIQWCREKGCLT